MSELEKCMKKAFEEAEKELEEIKLVQKSIKHPHFKYAVYNGETGEVIYKWKPWYKWFSGKRVVHIKVRKLNVHMPEYWRED